MPRAQEPLRFCCDFTRRKKGGAYGLASAFHAFCLVLRWALAVTLTLTLKQSPPFFCLSPRAVLHSASQLPGQRDLQRIFFLTSFFVKQTNPAPGAVQQHLICLCVEKLKLLADQHPGGGAGGQPWGPWLPTPSSPWLLILPDKAAAL